MLYIPMILYGKPSNFLLENNIGATPVLDKTGALVGMLSAVDLLRALDDMIDEERIKKPGNNIAGTNPL